MLKTWWAILLTILYPPRCPSCHCRTVEDGAWCGGCIPEGLLLRELSAAGLGSAALELCFTVLPYDSVVKRLLHRLKFHPDPAAARYFVWLLQNRINWAKLPAVELIVPVPLSTSRIAERGFNQTELLFRPWSQGWGIWVDTLTRCRDTQPQWRLSPIERRRNLRGAFAVTQPELVKGRSILLVDDIFTTGVTLTECARALKKAGAKEVYGLALASGAPR